MKICLEDIRTYYTDLDSGWSCEFVRIFDYGDYEFVTVVNIYDEEGNRVIHSDNSTYDILSSDSAKRAIADAFITDRYWERKKGE